MAHSPSIPCDHCKEAFEALRKLAYTDELTDLPNRRSFDDALRSQMARATKNGSPLSLALLDLDHFKEINDAYGHVVGDTVLKQLGKLLRHVYRASDFIARIGGEEFAIILPGASLHDNMLYLERVRAEIERALVIPIVEESPITVTVSLGVAEKIRGDSRSDLLTRADKALYTAKREGRNRVVQFGVPEENR